MIADKDGRIVPVHGDHHPVEVYQARNSRNLHGGAEFIGSRLATDGTLYSQSGYAVSHAIPVKAGMVLTKSTASDPYHRWAFYNSTDTYGHFISASVENTVTVPAGATFARTCYLESEAGSVIVCEGNVALPYEPYGTVTDTIFKPTLLKKSGTELTFEQSYNDSAEVEVSGKSEQESYSGKNIFLNPNPVFYSSDTGNSNCTTRVDDYQRIIPVRDGNCYHNPGNSNKYNIGGTREQGKTYTISFDIKTPDTIGMYWYPSEHYSLRDYIKGSSDWQRVSYTYTQTGPTVHIGEKPADSVNANGLFGFHSLVAGHEYCYKNIQLEQSSAATPYEPYVGGIPSPNPNYPQPIESIESMELASRGRNIVGTKNYGLDFHATGNVLSNVNVDSRTFPQLWVRCLDDAGTVLSNNVLANNVTGKRSLTFKTAPGTKHIMIVHNGITRNLRILGDYYGSSRCVYAVENETYTASIEIVGGNPSIVGGFVVKNIQIETGATANPYEPYHSTTRVIDFQGHQLRSVPDGTLDYLTVRMDGSVEISEWTKIIYSEELSNFQWSVVSTLTNGKLFYANCPYTPYVEGSHPPIVSSNYFVQFPNSEMYSGDADAFGKYAVGTYRGTSIRFFMPNDSGVNGVDDFRQWLASKGDLYVIVARASKHPIVLPSIEPIPTYWPTTVLGAQGVDISAFVKVIE